jgi:hypothetical protein
MTVASGATVAVPIVFNGSFANFEGVSVSGFGQPGSFLPILLQSTSIEVNNAGSPTGFATVNLPVSWTETLEPYLDPANGVFALTSLLGTASFNTVDSETDITLADTGAGPYSLTAVYRVTAPTIESRARPRSFPSRPRSPCSVRLGRFGPGGPTLA